MIHRSSVYWTTHARRFTGESGAVREAAIAELRKDPQLTQKLQRALGTHDHFLALDVISVLKLRAMLPHLLKSSAQDRTGYSYHVINSLLTEEDIESTGEIYRERLKSETTTPAAKIALLDALGRMEVHLDSGMLHDVFLHEAPEVRSAALYYVRTAALKWKRGEYLGFLETGLRDRAHQNRAQSLFLLSELPDSYLRAKTPVLKKLLTPCRQDPEVEVRELCESIWRKFPGEVSQ